MIAHTLATQEIYLIYLFFYSSTETAKESSLYTLPFGTNEIQGRGPTGIFSTCKQGGALTGWQWRRGTSFRFTETALTSVPGLQHPCVCPEASWVTRQLIWASASWLSFCTSACILALFTTLFSWHRSLNEGDGPKAKSMWILVFYPFTLFHTWSNYKVMSTGVGIQIRTQRNVCSCRMANDYNCWLL